jgi:type IV pilus assembly protein PilY1
MLPSRTTRFFAWLTLASFFSANVHSATVDIASVPLVSMSTKLVRPNVLFILDDSTSMNSEYMPDSASDDTKACYYNFGYNKIYYNPGIIYAPPKNAVLPDKANASVTAAYDNGFNNTGGPRNLTLTTTTATGTTPSATRSLNSNPLAMTAGNSLVTVTTPTNHGLSTGTQVVISGLNTSGSPARTNNMSINGNPFTITVNPAFPNRFTFTTSRNATATGNYGGGGASYVFLTTTYTTTQDYYYYSFTANPTSPPSTCDVDGSYTQVPVSSMTGPQQQNFANWYSYYRTRLMMMKSAAGRAFSGVDDKFRVGFTTINERGTAAARWLDMAKFDTAQKTSWYSKLYGINITGINYTPLRGALSKAGRYYAGRLVTGNTDPVQYSCQKNFSILTTDGYWNKAGEAANYGPKREDNSTDVGDQDGSPAPPATPYPIYDAGAYSNTLADVARYYYKTDLRTTTANGGLRDDGLNLPVDPNIKAADGTTDLPDGHQHMKTLTLGLGMDGVLANPGAETGLADGTIVWPNPQTGVSGDTTGIVARLDDLWHAAVNGGGTYASASDPEEAVNALRAALANISDNERSGAAAATSSLEPVTSDNFAYIAQYTTARWTGDIEARTIDLITGSISGSFDWSAQALLEGRVGNTTDTRNIYTWNAAGTARIDFTPALVNPLNVNAALFDASTLSQYSGLSAAQQANATADSLINYIRGQHDLEMRNDATHTTVNNRIYRARATYDTSTSTYTNQVLGDIIDTSPVFVKKPPFRYADAGYAAYVGTNSVRAGTVYAGANDGMLHAFDSTTGAERWAYIPRMLHGRLAKLADAAYSSNHRYYVDGTITVGDAWNGSSWRTVLIAGLGAGGKGYFALDITDPANPSVLWEYTNADLGYSFGNPILTKRASDGTWVVLFASGYQKNDDPTDSYDDDTSDGQGRLFMLNAFTGASLGSIATTAGTDRNQSGIAKITNWVLDTLVDNSTQYVYGGDLAGNLWRFDINTLAVQRMGQTSATAGALPITGRPEVARIRDATGTYHRVVYLGTGRYLGATDVTGSSLSELNDQVILAVKDDGTDHGILTAVTGMVQQTLVVPAIPPPPAPIPPRTITSPPLPVNWATQKGWFVTIPRGERITIEPRLQLGTVSFVSNKPTDDYCSLGGSSWLYALDYRTGGAITTQPSNVVGMSVDGKTIGTGLTIVRLPNGLLIAIVNTPDGTRTLNLPNGGAGAGTVRRVGYREIN